MDNIEKREITSELQEAYIDYAMSVIVSRALPDVRDGLKPVHRRILWGMWDSGSTADAKLKKSANIVGEVMGKYHPHGDLSIYDALVRMAQDFSLRYPLVQGQGNFGSVDGDNAAAMRYTEVRLARIADELLLDIEKETVDWQPNYDGIRLEPKVLTAKLPNLLLGGSVGIAVGMTTNIPPHNLSEVADAILYLVDNPKAGNDDLLKFIKGPDFPTGGIIFDRKAIAQVYETGRGTITIRAKAEIEERHGREGSRARGFNIVATEIPYQVNKAELIVRIAELVQNKKIEGIHDLRDESDKDGLRIVIELKNDAPPQKILNQLYRQTDLQKDFHANMIALVGGIQPQLLSLKDILVYYLEHRTEVVRRRAQFDLKKAEERAHILEGLVKALSVIDRIIATIKKSKDRDEAHKNLVKNFKLSDIQATAILEMRLQSLANLERQKIEDELKEKLALIKELNIILKNPARILKIIKDEVKELKDNYGDERKTKVVATGLTEFKDEDLIPEEEAIIALSSGGYVKRLAPDSFKSQRRGGKGLVGSDVADEDFITHFLSTKTHDQLLFFTDRGRVFQIKAHEIPAASRTAKGKAIHNFLELPTNENISAIVNSPKLASGDKSSEYLVMVTQDGLIKKTPIGEFQNIRRSGIIALDLKKNDLLKWVGISHGKDEVVLTTRGGQAIRFKETQIRSMGRSAAGVRAIRLRSGDHVAGFDIIKDKKSEKQEEQPKGVNRLVVVMENGFAKQTALTQYKVQNRGGSGIKTAKITKKTGSIISSKVVREETEIFALSAKGQVIRTELSSVRMTGRAAQGVRIMNLKSGDRLAGIVIV
ncbi:MAG: DNA gyrase subunit A [Patescibacteria group bacterium]